MKFLILSVSLAGNFAFAWDAEYKVYPLPFATTEVCEPYTMLKFKVVRQVAEIQLSDFESDCHQSPGTNERNYALPVVDTDDDLSVVYADRAHNVLSDNRKRRGQRNIAEVNFYEVSSQKAFQPKPR